MFDITLSKDKVITNLQKFSMQLDFEDGTTIDKVKESCLKQASLSSTYIVVSADVWKKGGKFYKALTNDYIVTANDSFEYYLVVSS